MMRKLSYFSLFCIWVSMCAFCAIAARVNLNLPGGSIYGSPKAVAIGVGVGSLFVLPMAYLMFTGHKMRRKRALGPIWVCKACGYDLRGAIGANACPECGHSVSESRRSMLQVMHERGLSDTSPRKRA